MTRVLADRHFLIFGLVCLLFLMIGGVAASIDHFTYTVSGQHAIVTRAAQPILYWSVVGSLLAVATASAAMAVRRARVVLGTPKTEDKVLSRLHLVIVLWFVILGLLIVVLRYVPPRR